MARTVPRADCTKKDRWRFRLALDGDGDRRANTSMLVERKSLSLPCEVGDAYLR
jgi:hypothetical protein